MTKEQLEKKLLAIVLQPKQQELYEAIVFSFYLWIGYGGARGGAKSHGIRDCAILIAFKLGITVLIFRRIREELLANHVYPFLKHYPFLRKYFNKQELVIYHPITGLPAIKFGYAETNDDIEKFQGTEYPVIFIDEATKCTQYQIEFLSTSNRDPNEQFVPKMVLTMNPGGVSHSYIKRIFIDKVYLPNDNPKDYYFIQAYVWDNYFWVKKQLLQDAYAKIKKSKFAGEVNNKQLLALCIKQYYQWSETKRREYCLKFSSYAKRLSTLPHDLMMAFLFGDWTVFAGMFFKGIDIKKQIIEPFQIPKGWKLFAALDPGYSSPCSFSISAIDYDFNVYEVATYYERDRSAPQHAEAVASFIRNLKVTGGRMPERIVADPSAWQKRDRLAAVEDLRTFADHFNEAGINLERAVNDRITGWWNMKDFMTRKNIDGSPKFLIFDKMNKPFIDQLLGTMSDNKQPEDIEGKGNNPDVEDHAIDERRYKFMMIAEAVPEKKKDPIEQMLEDEMGDPEDAYSVMGI